METRADHKSQTFFKKFISDYSVQTILDFASFRNLFEAADTKIVAIVANSKTPKVSHQITHLTFRRTKSVYERIGFELDHYDWHEVSINMAQEFPFIWKANLLGGGRLVSLSQKLSNYPTMKEFWDDRGWTHGEGFIEGNEGQQRMPAEWITGHRHLPTTALTADGVQESNVLESFAGEMFTAPRIKSRFLAPMFLIRENETLPTVFLDKGHLTFKDKIISVNAVKNECESLKQFANYFDSNKNFLKAICYLKSSQMLIGKSTAILKTDIDNLPYPPMIGEDFQLSWWEQSLIDDIQNYTAELIRVGQNAKALTQTVDKNQMFEYGKIFVKLLGSIYSNLHLGQAGYMGGLAYQSFFFGDKSDLAWPNGWDEKLYNLIYKDNSAIFTTRIVRFYEANTLIIVKPDRLRYWIPSTAIWDADETLDDMQKQGF